MVYEWTRHLRAELRASLPVYGELDELRQRVEEHIRDHVASPEDRFSKEEADDLRTKLGEMLQRFEELKERSELTDGQLRELQKQVETLSEDLRGFRKSTWYRTAFTKLFTFGKAVASTPEGQKLIVDAARKVIGVDSTSGA
jgi:chromosome segregation ATPase